MRMRHRNTQVADCSDRGPVQYHIRNKAVDGDFASLLGHCTRGLNTSSRVATCLHVLPICDSCWAFVTLSIFSAPRIAHVGLVFLLPEHSHSSNRLSCNNLQRDNLPRRMLPRRNSMGDKHFRESAPYMLSVSSAEM
jgi:hypothetical protein